MGGNSDPSNAMRGCSGGGRTNNSNASSLSSGSGGASSSRHSASAGRDAGAEGCGSSVGGRSPSGGGGNPAGGTGAAAPCPSQGGSDHRRNHNQNLFHPALLYNPGFRALLLSVSVTIILRLLEDVLFPNLYQAPPAAGEGAGAGSFDGGVDPYCGGRFAGSHSNRDDELEDHVLALLCDWSWVAIVSPFPCYIFLRSRGRVCELSASTGRFLRPGGGGRRRRADPRRGVGGDGGGDGAGEVEEGDVGEPRPRRGRGWPLLRRWKRAVRSITLWFLRPAALQPMTVCSTPEETAVLAMLCLMDDEAGRRKKVGGNDDDENSGEKKTSRGESKAKRRDSSPQGGKSEQLLGGLDTVLSNPDDVERHLRSLMNSSPSSQAHDKSASSFASYVSDDNPLCWSNPGTTSELRPLAVFLIAASAAFRWYSIYHLADRSRYHRPSPPPPSPGQVGLTEGGDGGAGVLNLVGNLLLHYSETRLRGLRRLVVGPGGPYSLTRNPMAVSSLTSALGFLLASPSPVGFVALPVLLCATCRQVWREEGELMCLYGDAYRIYRRGVPRFLGLAERLEELILTTTPQGSLPLSHEYAGDMARSFLLAVAVSAWLVLFWDYGGLSQLPRLLMPSWAVPGWARVGARSRARGRAGNSFPSFVRDGADSLFASRLRAMDLMATNDDGDDDERATDDDDGRDTQCGAPDGGGEDPSDRGAAPRLSGETPASSPQCASSLRSRRDGLASRVALARRSLAADCMRLNVGGEFSEA